jgi:thiamine-phosphate pyrophosphorylase
MRKKELYRIIDANFNRSREGLRVCEDIARFAWNSPSLTRSLKKVRHSISSILKDAPLTARILRDSRDSRRDVGRRVHTASEMSRSTHEGIFGANIQRVKESLRVLEEFFKLIDSADSAKLTNLRFSVYEIEKKALK